jgi:hypothetical protein
MIDYRIAFWVLIAFIGGYISYSYMDWWNKRYKECEKCQGRGYVGRGK